MKKSHHTLLCLLATLTLAICSFTPSAIRASDAAPTAELTVFAAASLKDVLNELAVPFEKEHGAKIVFNYAGSNVLSQQIIASPKADVFLSANEKCMDDVAKAGDMAAGTRKSIISNTLVVIANPAAGYAIGKPEDLPALNFKFLALGDPAAVPAGKYAKAWLSGIKYGQGTAWDAVKDRISPAPDVRAAMGQVEAKEDVVGIVYGSDAVSAKGKVKVIYDIPPSKSLSISYPAAMIAQTTRPELAKAFLAYLETPQAKAAFEKYGFIILK